MSRPRYYDRAGQPITLEEWGRRLDFDNRVALTVLPDGTRVSTVWLGLDHRWGDGPPLIFETMVFTPGDGDEAACERWTTEEEARRGHQQQVELWMTRQSVPLEESTEPQPTARRPKRDIQLED